MNSDLFNGGSGSPLSTQSWIVDNLRSIISNQEDDCKEFANKESHDCSLSTTIKEDEFNRPTNFNSNLNFLLNQQLIAKMSQQQNIYDDASLDYEIEKSRTVCQQFQSDELYERIPKRPFSPEEITSLQANAPPFYPQYLHSLNNNNNNNNSNNSDETNLSDLNLVEALSNAQPLTSTSDYFSDCTNLNLDDSNPYHRSRLFQAIQNNNKTSRFNEYSDLSTKKKKLTNNSSIIVPKLSVTKPETHNSNNTNFNNSILNNDCDDFLSFSKNTNQSGSSFLFSSVNIEHSTSPTSSFLIGPNFNNINQTNNNINNNQIYSNRLLNQAHLSNLTSSSSNPLLNQGQFITNTSTPSSKLFNHTKIPTNLANNPMCANLYQHETDNFNNYNNNSSFYDLKNAHLTNSNLLASQRNVNEAQKCNPMQRSYLNELNGQLDFSNCLDESFKKNFNNNNNNNNNNNSKYNLNNHLNKKITKSSTTLFKENSNSPAQFFTHSSSYDNMSSLRNELKNPANSCLMANKHFKEKNCSDILDSGASFHHHHQQHQQQQQQLNNKWQANNNKQQTQYYTVHKQQQLQSQIIQPSMQQQQQQQQVTPNNSICAGGNSLQQANNNKDQIVLHVRNLDYKISADEWKRILLENFRKHCKEILSVNVVTNADKSLLGIVRLGSKEDARLAISCLHHKKIGYKRLNVNIAFSSNTNSPKSKIVAILKTNDSSEMALTKFIELYESRYNQSITVSELFKLKDIVHITQSRDGQGRQIKLTGRNYQVNIENEMQDLLHTPYCSLHSHKQNDVNLKETCANSPSNSSPVCWLPNVVVSLRTFKSAVHKLLNDHGGQMPLLSFMDCYKCCILNENLNSTNYQRNPAQSGASSLAANTNSNQLSIDNENGVSLEHLITCAQDVQIQYNEGFYKQLQWENDKSKPVNLQSKNRQALEISGSSKTEQFDIYGNELDDSLEESQRKLNQFSHEVVELFKGVPRCVIPLSKFNNEYHKKYGKQCRVADYGYTKLYELLESIPHILQILGSEYEKKLTLTHRVQVRRFSNDLIKVLKSHSAKQMFADEYPLVYEKHFGKQFDIRDYGVCFLEDMLAELPESIICRKEIEGRTFIQIPKIVQMEEERLCTIRLGNDIVDMLKYKPRFSIQFNKFIPNFHHHFGRQCKLSNYGFTKLIELLEAMPDTVQVFTKDGLQFVQLKETLMVELICLNLVKHLDENGQKLKSSLAKLEEWYNSKHEPLFYADFNCENFEQLFNKLPLRDYCVSFNELDGGELSLEVETLNERDVKRFSRNLLKRIIDECEEQLLIFLNESKMKNRAVRVIDLCQFLVHNNVDLLTQLKSFNKRSLQFVFKMLGEFLVMSGGEGNESFVLGLSDVFQFARQIRNVFKVANVIDITLPELEVLYKQNYKHGLNGIKQENQQQFVNGFPYKRLGFIDSNLLFSQGLALLVTVKKFSDRRICLNKEFWPPISPMNNQSTNRTPYANNSFTSLTPISQRLSSSSLSSSSIIKS